MEDTTTESSPKGSPKKKKILIFFLILLFILSIFTLSIHLVNKKKDKYIYEGISINNIYLGGLSKEAAIEKLENDLETPLKDRKLILIFKDDKKIHLSLEDLDVKYDIENIAKEVYSYKKNSNLFIKFKNRINLKLNPINIDKKFTFNEDKLNKFIDELYVSLKEKPKDATLSFNNNGEFEVQKEVLGLEIDKDELNKLIIEKIKSQDNPEIKIPTKIINCKIKYDDLIKIKDKISSYTTYLTNNVNRTNNIRIAAKALNNSIIMPDETFSMNKALGPRTREKGYTDAIIFENNQPVPGLAGGICQLVSTAYNTVLLANLEVVERTPHSLPVTYVPAGRDATIAGDSVDFKFKNNKNYPIYIESYVKDNSVTVTFYGKK